MNDIDVVSDTDVVDAIDSAALRVHLQMILGSVKTVCSFDCFYIFAVVLLFFCVDEKNNTHEVAQKNTHFNRFLIRLSEINSINVKFCRKVK